MFTNNKRQLERTGKEGTSRQEHLQNLVTEFQNPTITLQTKLQILSNLSNFAYDPYNYTFLRSLNVLELFLDHLSDPNDRLVEFAAAGICNASVDPENARVIVQCGGVEGLVECLGRIVVGNVVKYAICGLFYLCEFGGGNVSEVLGQKDVIDKVVRLVEGGESCVVVRNLGRVLLDKHLLKFQSD